MRSRHPPARQVPGVFSSLRGYDRRWLRGDLIAGLTVWAVLVPESLAYASIAGVSPVVGLYAAPAALILYAAFGSSRHLIVGPMSATAALSAATVGDLVAPSGDRFVAMTAALAIATGIAALLAGVLRLGFLASFISEPVIKGFIVGLALTILIGQVPKLLGIEKGSGDFFEQAWDVISHLGSIDGLTLAVGLASLAGVMGLKRFVPMVPGSLVIVLAGIAAVALLDLEDHGLDVVGTIPSGLPSLGWPDLVAAIAAMLGVLIFDTLPGLFIGIGASLLLLLFRASRPYVAHIGKVPGTPDQYGDIARHPENVSPEGVTILRFESGLFFANADWVRNGIRTAAHGEGVTGVVLDAESVPSIDVTAARMLEEVADELQRDGIGFVMARDVGQVRDILREADETGRPRMATTIPEAIEMVGRERTPASG
jgi:MFS superfamily sulfate permease-like transporter